MDSPGGPKLRQRLLRHLFFSLLLLSLLINSSQSTDLICDERDAAVLLKIKASFNNPEILSEWDPSYTCCEWNYVGCSIDPDFHATRVTAVTFSVGTGISGDLPALLGELPYLEAVMFTGESKLTGPIPDSFSKLKYLDSIVLSSNSLTGPIPGFLSKMKYLQNVDFSGNHFTGRIPPSLSNLHQLATFNAARNRLTGSIPNPPGNMTAFDVSHNMLVGPLPRRFGQLRLLESIDVSYNQLCGPIPAGLNRFGPDKFGRNKCLCGSPLSACK